MGRVCGSQEKLAESAPDSNSDDFRVEGVLKKAYLLGDQKRASGNNKGKKGLSFRGSIKGIRDL